MSKLDEAINKINNSASRADNTTNFFDNVVSGDENQEFTNPNNNKQSKSVKGMISAPMNSQLEEQALKFNDQISEQKTEFNEQLSGQQSAFDDQLTNQKDDFDTSKDGWESAINSQFIYKNGGDWTDAPAQITEADKLTYWMFTDGSGYAVKGSVTLPIDKPSTPVNDDNWFTATSINLRQMRTDSASQLGLVYDRDWFAGIVIDDGAMTARKAIWHNGQFYSIGTDTGFTSNDFDVDLVAGRFVIERSVTEQYFEGNCKAFGIKPGRAISESKLQAWFDHCDAKGWIPKWSDGGFNLPLLTKPLKVSRYGMIGASRTSTDIYIAAGQTGRVFDYNGVGDWGNGQGQFEDFSIWQNNKDDINVPLTISTPSRGFLYSNASIQSNSACIDLFDSYYVTGFNPVFRGWYFDAPPTSEENRYRGIAVRSAQDESNNLSFYKIDARDLSQVFVGTRNVFQGSNAIEVFGGAMENIGDCVLGIEGWAVNFHGVYFEKLNQNKEINIGKTENMYTTCIATAGAGDIEFNNCLLNCQEATQNDSNYAIFQSILNKITFNGGALQLPSSGYTGEILRDTKYSTKAVIVNNSCTGLGDINRGAYERPSQQFTKVYPEVGNKKQIAASQMMVDHTKASCSYGYLTNPSPNAQSLNTLPFGMIDAVLTSETCVIRLKATQYRKNMSNGFVGWIDIDVCFTVDATQSYFAYVNDITVKKHGDNDCFVDTESEIMGKVKCWRLTPFVTTARKPIAYQIGIVGETTLTVPVKITTDVSIECAVVDFGQNATNDVGFGIYQNNSYFVAAPTN